MTAVQENIVLEFDAFSANYTRDMENCVPHYLKLVSSIVESLPEKFSPQRILDMGCGNGNVTAQLVAKFPSASYMLVDASPEMIRMCQDRFQDYNISYFEGYFEQFEMEYQHYDLVVAGFSLHHINSKEKALIFQQIHSSLRPSGIFATSDLMIHKTNPEHPALKREWEEFVLSNHDNAEKWNWLMEHYDTFDTPDNWKDQVGWLNDAGFSAVNIPWQEGYWTHIQAIK